MRTELLRRAGIAVAGLGALVGGSVWPHLALASEVEEAGATTTFYNGPGIQVAVSWKYARCHPEGRWLLLDTELGSFGGTIGIPRSDVAVKTPTGEVVPLATQAEFEKGYRELASAIKRDDFVMEHLDYLLKGTPRSLDLFRLHGVGWVWPKLWLDPFHNCYGRLYFQLPKGVQKGRYELLIHLPKQDVVIPFTV